MKGRFVKGFPLDMERVVAVDASVGAMAGLLRERLGTVAEIDCKAEEELAEVSVGYGRALVERLRKETGR